MSIDSAILEGRNIEIRKGRTVIINVPQIKIKKGEFVSFIGPNGAGKTTLLQTLCCLLKPNKGEIFFNGKKVNSGIDVVDFRRKVTMVFQEPLLFDTKVFDNVASGLRFRGVKKADIEQKVIENLDVFGITHLKDRFARTLSGGEARRTCLARAFATEPEILLLDEPFVFLDYPTRESLFVDLEKILGKTKTTTIFATHDYLEAIHFSDRFVVMEKGMIVQTGSFEEVMEKPVNKFISSFAAANRQKQTDCTSSKPFE